MSKLGFIVDKVAVELNTNYNKIFYNENIMNLINEYMNNPEISYKQTLDKIKLYLI